MLYTEPIELSTPTTVTIYATHETYGDSPEISATYIINLPQVATPTFTPSSTEPHHNQFTLEITTTTEDATIHYTTDGSLPTNESSIYQSPITINLQTTVVRAFAVKENYHNSEEIQEIYTINTANPEFSVEEGTYTTIQILELSCLTDGAEIYYTLNEATETLYSEPITLSETTTITIYATHPVFGSTNEFSATYTINLHQVETPIFTPSATHPNHNPFTVTITSTTEDAEIYYTTDATDPSLPTATLYTTPLNITDLTTVVRAIAKKEGMIDSEERIYAFHITTATPVFSLEAGTYTEIITLELTCFTTGADIYYRLNLEDFDRLYETPIEIAETTTVTIFAYHETYRYSPEISAEYIINLPQLAPLIFTPPAGEYENQVIVSITPNPENEGIDAEIRYTTDGTEPTSTSTLYTNNITVTSDTNIRARAFATGYIASEIASAEYLITTRIQDPEFDIPTITSISRAYPNPVKSSMNVSFDAKVKLNETATVKIYNLKGQLVKEFTPINSGIHKLSWNRRDNNNNEVATGIYFYQIISPTTNHIQKMLIIK
jgi:hypothetical protein